MALLSLNGGARHVEDDVMVLPEPLEETQRPPFVAIASAHRQNLAHRSFALDGIEQPFLEPIDGEHEISERMRPG